ncbi:alpha/beta hydrolase family protein [Altererythrobacter fulvus]|uniref:alpha/beta hydrolase family protein n=1 Tax=Caenibius fulvus TaxID=2126012 RepID=UPI003018444B
MVLYRFAPLCAALFIATSLAEAPLQAEERDLAASFGSRGTVLNISLSPGGSRVAYVAPAGPYEEMIYVLDLAGEGVPRPIALDSNHNGFLTNCDWASEDYLICNFRGTTDFGGMKLGFTRMLVVATDGSGVRVLSERDGGRTFSFNQFGGAVLSLDVPGKPNSIMLERAFNEKYRTGTRIGSSASGVGIELVDLKTLKRSMVMQPREVSAGYVTDENGEVRIMATMSNDTQGYMRDKINFAYTTPGGKSFTSLEPDMKFDEYRVLGVDSAKNVAFALAEKDGFDALYTVTLDDTGKTELLLSQEQNDVDGLVRLGRKGRVVGATFATERRHFQFFDPALAKLSSSLTKALPGSPLVEIIDASSDEQRLLILAHSDINPGIVYILDRKTGELTEVVPMRGKLEGMTLANVRAVSYPARDGTSVPGYLTLPPGSDGKGLPAIVMPHGGPGSRDEWGFDWLAQYYAQLGFAVLQPNFRGSTGYGKAWEMDNGFQSWEIAIADVADAGKWLVSEGTADGDRLAVVGWSYGGYAALQSAATEPGLFKAVLAIAPVTDLGQLRDDARNYTSYPLVSEFLGQGSHIEKGSPARNARNIGVPVMLAHGTADESVSLRHTTIMSDALAAANNPAKVLIFDELDHGLRDDGARTTLLRESGTFLRNSLKLN